AWVGAMPQDLTEPPAREANSSTLIIVPAAPWERHNLFSAGVIGACALGLAAGVWFRPGQADQQAARPTGAHSASTSSPSRLQIRVDPPPARAPAPPFRAAPPPVRPPPAPAKAAEPVKLAAARPAPARIEAPAPPKPRARPEAKTRDAKLLL